MSEVVIACTKEKAILDAAYDSNEAEFIAIFGRRRIGKTNLIKNHLRAKDCKFFYVVGMQNGTLQDQLKNFTDSISETFLDGIEIRIPSSWRDASAWQYSPPKYSKQDGAQVDLLFDRNDGIVTLCDMKCTDEPYILDKQKAAMFEQKRNAFIKITKTTKPVMLVLISATGIKQTMYSEELIHDVISAAAF